MLLHDGRSGPGLSPTLAEGWRMERLTPPSRLFGANGLRTGPDGRIYIAQVTGSQISALDVGTGQLETISAKGGDIVAPDDVAFGPRGDLFATEVMDGRVSVRGTDGRTRVLRGDVPSANGITVHEGRLFIGECREGGRLLELDLDGGEPRVLLENVPSPNAMEVGPDGLLYFPVMGANEIWRISLDGGEPDIVATGLGVPDSVKFDSAGQIVSTQVHSGQVLRIDPRTGEQNVLANLSPGLDNCAFVGDRLFVSNFTGEITEVLDGTTNAVLPGGLNWPLDLAIGADGQLYIADGTYFYVLRPDHTLQTVGMLFTPGYPGFLRGLAPAGPGEFIVTTSGGQVSRYRPASGESEVIADGFDQLYGVAIGPDGTIAAAELGTGRVITIRGGRVEMIASGLVDPIGVEVAPDGGWLVSEAGAGRVVHLSDSGVKTTAAEFDRPQGILVDGRRLYVVDAGAKALISVDEDGARHTIASGLPLGAAPGVVPKPLKGMPPFSGPQGPFAGITAGTDGIIYVSADADGSVLAFRSEGRDD